MGDPYRNTIQWNSESVTITKKGIDTVNITETIDDSEVSNQKVKWKFTTELILTFN